MNEISSEFRHIITVIADKLLSIGVAPILSLLLFVHDVYPK